MNELLTAVKENTLSTIESINNNMVDIVETLARGENDAKKLAFNFYMVQNNPDRDKYFAEKDLYQREKDGSIKTDSSGCKKVLAFKQAIDKLFNGVYSGDTAYKYSLCYKYFHKRDEWERMNMGKMIILSPIMSEKATNDGYGIDKFYTALGCEYFKPTLDAHNAWAEKNASILETVEFLKKSKAKPEMIQNQLATIEPEPVIMGYVFDETAGTLVYDIQLCKEKGLDVACEMSDKALKTRVSEWVNAHNGKADKADGKTSKDGEKADKAKSEKSIAELKADALAAMLAYTAKLDNIPEIFGNAIAELEKDGDK